MVGHTEVHGEGMDISKCSSSSEHVYFKMSPLFIDKSYFL